MEDLLVKDFARDLGVTDRAVYKQLDKHRLELEGKIVKRPKQTWLTPEAQEIIRSYMVQSPAMVVESETLRELQELRREKEDFRSKYETELENTRAAAIKIADLNKNAGLLEAAQEEKKKLEEQKKALESENGELRERVARFESERNNIAKREGSLTEQLVQEKTEHVKKEKELQFERDAARERAVRAETERDAAYAERDSKVRWIYLLAGAAAILVICVIVMAIGGR